MNNKGFTLLELLIVVAILGVAAVIVAVNFFNITGQANEYEQEELFKYLNEAAMIYYDSDDYDHISDITSGLLYEAGYIDDEFGLLKDGEIDKNYKIIVGRNADGEKTSCVETNEEKKVKGACDYEG